MKIDRQVIFIKQKSYCSWLSPSWSFLLFYLHNDRDMSTFLGPSWLRTTQGWKLRILVHVYYRKTFQDSKLQTYNLPEKHCWTRYLVFLNTGLQIHQLGKSCFSMHKCSHDYMNHAKMPPIHPKIEATVLLIMIIINATSQNSSHSLN